MIESSGFRVLTWKYSGLIIGALLTAIGILEFYNPEGITDWKKLVAMSAIGVGLITFNIINYDKVKKVKINHSKIIYHEKGIEKIVPWNEVSSVYRAWSFSNPMYGVRIDGKSFIFPTESIFSSFSFKIGSYEASYDYSQMGDIIKKVKENYNI